MTKLKIIIDKLRKNKWEIIDWTMFFVCLFCSYYFFIGTWEDYAAKKSSFTIEEHLIKGQPTVTLTFSNQEGSVWDRSMFELGSEINITYYVMDSTSILATVPLKEKDNTTPELKGEVISMRKFKSAYKITSLNPNYEHKVYQDRLIKLDFSPTIAKEKLPAKVTYHFSSEENSFGVESQRYYHGDIYQVEIKRKASSNVNMDSFAHFAHVIIKPNLRKVLQEKTGCSYRSYWEQVQSYYFAQVKKNCPTTCTSRGVPDASIEICKTFPEWTCAEKEFKKNLRKSDFTAACTEIGYQGRLQSMFPIHVARTVPGPISSIAMKWNEDSTAMISYKFETPEKMEVSEEYIVVPTFEMIGDIGGILGIFIGFAFSPFVTQMLEQIKNLFYTKIIVGKNIQAKKIFFNMSWTVVDWVAFLTLGSIALASVQGIWYDYANTKTSLSWSSEAISSHPTITMCFGPIEEYPHKTFELHSEMNISYAVNSMNFLVLNEKDNTSPKFGNETIFLEQLQRCYKISAKSIPTKGEERSIKIEFSPSLKEQRFGTKIFFYLTSATNSYGVEKEVYIEGNPYEAQVLLQHHFKSKLKPEKMKYLKEAKDGCDDTEFWNVVESTYASDVKGNCPLPCAPFKLPNSTYETCLSMGAPKNELNCNHVVLFEVIRKILQNGFSPCTKIEYKGKELQNFRIEASQELVVEMDGDSYVKFPPNFNDKPMVIFSYKFDTPETTDVYSEYIIVDFMAMVGSIGGTLGLYIGFSFFDFFMQILDWIQMLVYVISQSSIFKEEKKKDRKKEEPAKKTQVAQKPKIKA